MILAAGRGERMRPLTDTVPKPLLEVGGRPLIVHHLLALRDAGIHDIVINLGHLGDQIPQSLGKGERYGVRITYSDEGEHPLETAGGIRHALPYLEPDPFIVVNGDIWTDYPFSKLTLGDGRLGHIVLVDNPAHHPEGDFGLAGGLITSADEHRWTFSGIGTYHPDLFRKRPAGPLPLAPILREAACAGLLEGEHYTGDWQDIGTPERLAELNRQMARR
ncbi:MAG: NTP transferase domain-containing protein [Gammaproteobacteria bacterium]|nr:NTP transferase domain-containing protein [Gammaproteobacteria bacterium]